MCYMVSPAAVLWQATVKSAPTDGVRLLEQPWINMQWARLLSLSVKHCYHQSFFFFFLSLLLVSYVLILCNILYERESKNSLTIMNSGRLWFSNAVYYFWKLKCPEIDDARSNLENYNNCQTLHPSWKRTLTQCFKWIIWALWDM